MSTKFVIISMIVGVGGFIFYKRHQVIKEEQNLQTYEKLDAGVCGKDESQL